jgi:hypothetical protein
MLTIPITSASPTTPIDTTGFSWLSLQVGAGYVGQTSLTLQASNDQVTWFSVALSTSSATSSGLSTSMGITTNLFSGPIPARFLRFAPGGTYTSGTQTLVLYMQSLPGVLQSSGSNSNISAIGNNVAPSVALTQLTIGSGTSNGFQIRASSSADQAAATLIAAVGGQMPYITGIHCSVYGSGATPRQFRLVGAASALIEHNVACPANDGVDRMFRNPWKPVSAVNTAINLAVTSIGAAAGTWDIVVEGYYQTA